MKKTSISLALATILGFSLFASDANAQNMCPIQTAPVVVYDFSRDLNILDDCSRQIAQIYGREMRYIDTCSISMALNKEINRNVGLTKVLLRAHKGNSRPAFRKAALDVRQSLARMQSLRKNALRTDGIYAMIDTTYNSANNVYRNSDKFAPVTFTRTPVNVAPPVYIDQRVVTTPEKKKKRGFFSWF